MTRVALFTCFSPSIGGGAVNLRSVISAWQGIEVVWFHLRQGEWTSAVYLGEPLIGGPLVRDLWSTPKVWVTGRHPQVDSWIDQILDAKADAHWVVGMNEGFWVGNALRQRAPGTPLHVSVQDDQERGMFGRTRRYRWMARLVRRSVRQLLHGADSVDVTSDGMKAYYQRQFGVDSQVVHPFVARLSAVPPVVAEPETITIGHVGSLYDVETFVAFVEAAKGWSARQKKKLRVLLLGLSGPIGDAIRAKVGEAVVAFPGMSEEAAIQRLAKCQFVYAMYPFSRKSEIFRTTSFPTKLSTYVQAQRILFAHTPEPSTLASFVRQTGLGVVASSLHPYDLQACLDRIQGMKVADDAFERARESFYGEWNVRVLKGCFEKRL